MKRNTQNRLRRFIQGCLFAVFLLSIQVADAPAAGRNVEEGFSIVVLPDTQIYAWKYPEIFQAQTAWIAENIEEYNIRYVLHVGDVVQNNAEEEWKLARKAFARLDGKVPYAIALGNHDMGPNGSAENRETLYNKYFPLAAYRKWDTFGGVYDKEPEKADNCYHLFDAAGRRWLVLVLEFGPRDDVLRWASDVLSSRTDRSVILLTHAYLHNDGKRYDRNVENQHYPPYNYPLDRSKEGLNDGEEIWKKLVSKQPNVSLVISGHVCVSARLQSRGESGNGVCQMLVDYQTEERGGTGWLRLLSFPPGATSVHVRDYSPVLDKWSSRPDTQFHVKLSHPPISADRK